MFTIRNYTNTRCELEMAKTRLNVLVDRKEKLYCKYFPLSPTIKDVIVDGGDKTKDTKMADYLHELYEIVDVGTGMTLADELKYQQGIVDKLERYLNEMTASLSKMTGIEYKLYYEIVVNGVHVSKAVENIAIANEKDVRTIWNYYNKIKYEIKKLERFGYGNQIM